MYLEACFDKERRGTHKSTEHRYQRLVKVSKGKYILVSLFMGEVLAKAGSTLFLAWRGGSTSVAVIEANKIMRKPGLEVITRFFQAQQLFCLV